MKSKTDLRWTEINGRSWWNTTEDDGWALW